MLQVIMKASFLNPTLEPIKQKNNILIWGNGNSLLAWPFNILIVKLLIFVKLLTERRFLALYQQAAWFKSID